MWGGACIRVIGSATYASHPKRAEFQRSPRLGVLLYLCPQNDEIRHGNTHGEGCVLGQSRHCICTNASRGLLETAEFLVLIILSKQTCMYVSPTTELWCLIKYTDIQRRPTAI